MVQHLVVESKAFALIEGHPENQLPRQNQKQTISSVNYRSGIISLGKTSIVRITDSKRRATRPKGQAMSGDRVTCRASAILIAFLLLTQTQSVSQEVPPEWRHGTIIVWDVSPTKIIIVADSGVMSEVSGKLNEKVCKIASLSYNTLFFYTGNLAQAVDRRTGKEIFSQEVLAEEAYHDVKTQPRSYQRLVNIASMYSVLARPKMDKLVSMLPNPSERIGLAGFASLDESNRPRMVLVNIPVQVPNDGSPAYTGVPDIFEWPRKPQQTMGTGNYAPNRGVMEFLDGNTERAKQAVAKFDSGLARLPKRDVEVYRLIAAVEASMSWNLDDPSIGPPVDAVVIESRTGVRWVRRKPNCAPARPPGKTRPGGAGLARRESTPPVRAAVCMMARDANRKLVARFF
ncbi:MAG: hypothetical protein ACRD5M_09725 [Candidatus Acidiferrales bacterium]